MGRAFWTGVQLPSSPPTGIGKGSLFLYNTLLKIKTGTALGEVYGAGLLDRGSTPLVSTNRYR